MKTTYSIALSILSFAFFNAAANIEFAGAETTNVLAVTSKLKTKTQAQKVGASHCVKVVKIRFLEIYMQSDWIETARATARQRWRDRVTSKYGSVYSDWSLSSNQESSCKRIGFGNDDYGNIGRTIVCEISAIPCAKISP